MAFKPLKLGLATISMRLREVQRKGHEGQRFYPLVDENGTRIQGRGLQRRVVPGLRESDERRQGKLCAMCASVQNGNVTNPGSENGKREY